MTNHDGRSITPSATVHSYPIPHFAQSLIHTLILLSPTPSFPSSSLSYSSEPPLHSHKTFADALISVSIQEHPELAPPAANSSTPQQPTPAPAKPAPVKASSSKGPAQVTAGAKTSGTDWADDMSLYEAMKRQAQEVRDLLEQLGSKKQAHKDDLDSLVNSKLAPVDDKIRNLGGLTDDEKRKLVREQNNTWLANLRKDMPPDQIQKKVADDMKEHGDEVLEKIAKDYLAEWKLTALQPWKKDHQAANDMLDRSREAFDQNRQTFDQMNALIQRLLAANQDLTLERNFLMQKYPDVAQWFKLASKQAESLARAKEHIIHLDERIKYLEKYQEEQQEWQANMGTNFGTILQTLAVLTQDRDAANPGGSSVPGFVAPPGSVGAAHGMMSETSNAGTGQQAHPANEATRGRGRGRGDRGRGRGDGRGNGVGRGQGDGQAPQGNTGGGPPAGPAARGGDSPRGHGRGGQRGGQRGRGA